MAQAPADVRDAEPEELGTDAADLALSAVDPDQSDQALADVRDAEPEELGTDAAESALSTVAVVESVAWCLSAPPFSRLFHRSFGFFHR